MSRQKTSNEKREWRKCRFRAATGRPQAAGRLLVRKGCNGSSFSGEESIRYLVRGIVHCKSCSQEDRMNGLLIVTCSQARR